MLSKKFSLSLLSLICMNIYAKVKIKNELTFPIVVEKIPTKNGVPITYLDPEKSELLSPGRTITFGNGYIAIRIPSQAHIQKLAKFKGIAINPLTLYKTVMQNQELTQTLNELSQQERFVFDSKEWQEIYADSLENTQKRVYYNGKVISIADLK